MTRLRVTLDGRDLSAEPGTSILDLARGQGITIPTLCHDPRLEPDASCWLCVVEVRQGEDWSNQPACDTRVWDGMEVRTRSEGIVEARRWAIELLLSDHFADCVAPCANRCPADVDIPRYVKAVAEGRYDDAVQVIRETNPLPSVCGRVCPHTCELSCDRGVVDEPIAINQLKRLATDLAHPGPGAAPAASGKKVAVVGGGPAGLSAAWFLNRAGHAVTVFDAKAEPGGMLRYGIPDYRLPPEILGRDIDTLREAGVDFVGEQRLGRDLTVSGLLEAHAAVFLALGAWRGRSLGVPGDDAEGVFGGVPFLVQVSEGELRALSGPVVVIGGGNTAVDAARTAVRLGAERVVLAYRRDRDQMPAFAHEVDEAVEEGVELRCLAAPVEVVVAGGRAVGVKLQPMALGEPGPDGRPRPVATDAPPHVVAADLVIAAIGEVPDTRALQVEGLAAGRKVEPDARTQALAMEGVFAGGDFVSGPSTAVEAIAAGRRAAASIDAWLTTGRAGAPPPLVVSRRTALGEVTAHHFPGVPQTVRSKPVGRAPGERRLDFAEVELGVSEPVARAEAKRCLQCGCDAFDICTLRALMDEYQVVPDRLAGHAHEYERRELRPGIELDMNKCIRCNRCVRVCGELAGAHVLEFTGRGFDTTLFFGALDDEAMAACDRCLAGGGLCVDTCPTGALTLPASAGPEIIQLGRR